MIARENSIEVEVIYPETLIPSTHPSLHAWASKMNGKSCGQRQPSIQSDVATNYVSDVFRFPTEGHAHGFVGYADYRFASWQFGAGQSYFIVCSNETRMGRIAESSLGAAPQAGPAAG